MAPVALERAATNRSDSRHASASRPYFAAIRDAGLRVEAVRDNPQYVFISDNARNAARKYGVKSVSLVAVKAS